MRIAGRKTIDAAGTAEQMFSYTIQASLIQLSAPSTNTGTIYISGPPNVPIQGKPNKLTLGPNAQTGTQRGTPVAAGTSYEIENEDASLIWLDAVDTDDVLIYDIVF